MVQVQDEGLDVTHINVIIVVPDPLPDGRHVGDGKRERERERERVGGEKEWCWISDQGVASKTE